MIWIKERGFAEKHISPGVGVLGTREAPPPPPQALCHVISYEVLVMMERLKYKSHTHTLSVSPNGQGEQSKAFSVAVPAEHGRHQVHPVPLSSVSL